MKVEAVNTVSVVQKHWDINGENNQISNLIKHLKNRPKSESMMKPTTNSSMGRENDNENPRAVKITGALTQFIAFGDHSLVVTDNW